jgi:Fe-S cluster biogenesis protein NfuA
MLEDLDRVVNEFRPGFDADGFDVVVESIDPGGLVVVRVRHRPDACEECLMPDDTIAAIFKTAMRRTVPGVTGVELRHERPAAPGESRPTG